MRQARLIPSFFFAILVLGGLAIAFIGVRNKLLFPVIKRFPVAGGLGSIVAYDRGFRHRAADLFYEASATELPAYIAPLYYAAEDRDGHPRARPEFLAWSADGRAVFAVRQDTNRDAILKEDLLWLFDTQTSELSVGAAAVENLRRLGGPGTILAHHYDFGRKDPSSRIPSWQTTRWERALP